MSGTSLDGIDVSLSRIDNGSIQQLGCCYTSYPASLKQELHSLCSPAENELLRLSLAEQEWAKLAAGSINQLLQQQQLQSSDICAIGSHGQTIRHHPELGFSVQIGAPALLAELTQITVVTHFRQRDIAAGGQGAPLVPAFHQWLFQHLNTELAVVNIGGFSNVSFISPQQPTTGFDCGPGNVLLDAWIELHQQQAYDNNGAWAASGQLNQPLLEQLLTDDFFQRSGPKSTGRELFNLPWLQQHLQQHSQIAPADVQCTLTELSAQAISQAVIKHNAKITELWLCGGGARNLFLRDRISHLLPDIEVKTSDAAGIDADWMEAMAFAWLAYMCLTEQSASLPQVTGARGARILGAVYPR